MPSGRYAPNSPPARSTTAEAPLAAIKRELLEETGYASDEWHLLGSAPVNPALQTNRIHCFLALGAQKVAEQDLDEGEAIRTHELPLSEFIEQVEAGSLELPALQLASLYLLQSYLRSPPTRGLALIALLAGPQSAWRPRKRRTLPLSDSSSRGRPASTWLQNGLMFAPT